MSDWSASAHVKAKVGKRSVDKLVDVVVDVFSPATELTGALGDALRLGREEMAARITERAKEIGDANGLRLKAPPLKFLVPFYEKASLEDAESPALVEMWAGLLVNASSGQGETTALYCDLVSKMRRRTAEVFQRFCEQTDSAVAMRPFDQSNLLGRALAEFFHAQWDAPAYDTSAFKAAAALPVTVTKTSATSPPDRADTSASSATRKVRRDADPASSERTVNSTTFVGWADAAADVQIASYSELVSLGLFRDFIFDQDRFEPATGAFMARLTISGYLLTPIGAELFARTRV